jgi:hypothetical protein
MAEAQNQIILTATIDRQKRDLSLNGDQPPPEQTPPGLAITANVDDKNLHITFNEDIALTVTAGNQKRLITFKELTLSNNFALEALVKLLVDKKIIDVKDLQSTMDQVRQERYQQPPGTGS